MENLRLKLLIARYGRPMAIGLIVVAAVMLAAGVYLFATPTTATVTQETNQQQVETSVNHSAVVVERTGTAGNRAGNDSTTGGGGAQLWEPGTVLQDHPVYLTNATPRATINATTNIPGDGDATVTHRVVLVVEAAREDQTFWSNRTVIATNQGSGPTVETTTILDMQRVTRQVRRAQDEIRTVGVVSTRLEVVVDYETGPYQNTESRTTTLDIGPQSYIIGDGLSWERTHSTPVQSTVEQPREGSLHWILILVGVVAGGIAASISLFDPGNIDPERIKNRIHRQRYAHWISPGHLPFELDKDSVELESLEDLVDVAIDAQGRVVHDRRRDLFAVITESALYYHSINGDWTETSFPQFNTPGGQRETGASREESGQTGESAGIGAESTQGTDIDAGVDADFAFGEFNPDANDESDEDT